MNIFLIDADNLSAGAWLDEAFRVLEETEGPLPVRRAYGSAENLRGLSEALRFWAVRPFVNLSLTKNTTDIALAVDAMEFACQSPAPKMVVIGSGDADFVPLVVRLRNPWWSQQTAWGTRSTRLMWQLFCWRCPPCKAGSRNPWAPSPKRCWTASYAAKT